MSFCYAHFSGHYFTLRHAGGNEGDEVFAIDFRRSRRHADGRRRFATAESVGRRASKMTCGASRPAAGEFDEGRRSLMMRSPHTSSPQFMKCSPWSAGRSPAAQRLRRRTRHEVSFSRAILLAAVLGQPTDEEKPKAQHAAYFRHDAPIPPPVFELFDGIADRILSSFSAAAIAWYLHGLPRSAAATAEAARAIEMECQS